jgi:hypothetical protein
MKQMILEMRECEIFKDIPLQDFVDYNCFL